jgi:hypothetical protein
MHESVERRAGWSQSEIVLYNQTNGLRAVTNRPVRPIDLYIHCAPLLVGHSPTSSFDGIGSAMIIFLWSILYYYYPIYDMILNLIERLGLKWLSVFSVGGHIRVWILFRFIILFYLSSLFETSVCPKGFLLWPRIGTESFPFIIIFYFIISHIVISFWWYDNWSHTLIHLFLFCKVNYQI